MARRKKAKGMPPAMLAPAIVWMRMPIMMAEAMSPKASGGGETVRAVAEKAAAIAEGTVAAQMAIGAPAWQAWWNIASGKSPETETRKIFRSAQRAAEKPFNKRLRANYKRLSAR